MDPSFLAKGLYRRLVLKEFTKQTTSDKTLKHPSYGLSKNSWLLRNTPRIINIANRPTIPDYFTYKHAYVSSSPIWTCLRLININFYYPIINIHNNAHVSDELKEDDHIFFMTTCKHATY